MITSTINIKAIQPAKMPLWYVKWTNYEYWPTWLFFLPTLFYWLWLAIKARSPLYFTRANPSIELGGFFGESKTNILKQIPSQYLPKSVYITENETPENICRALQSSGMVFPLICKPDKGERGTDVMKIHNEIQLIEYFKTHPVQAIIQEYISFETELGILYYKYPDHSGSGITSITMKMFLTVTGDGFSTVKELLMENDRGRLQLKRLQIEKPELMDSVPGFNQQITVEHIGNHCKGTQFLNGNHLISQELVNVFDEITKDMKGFYFGRFDLRVNSIHDLLEGKNIRIMELNGTTSEPAHIYDPEMTLFKAYSDIFHNMNLVYTISTMNKNMGVKATPLKEFISTVINHFRK